MLKEGQRVRFSAIGISEAFLKKPVSVRAGFRGTIIKLEPGEIAFINWHHLERRTRHRYPLRYLEATEAPRNFTDHRDACYDYAANLIENLRLGDKITAEVLCRRTKGMNEAEALALIEEFENEGKLRWDDSSAYWYKQTETHATTKRCPTCVGAEYADK